MVAMDAEAKPIIFFDGKCGLCNNFLDFVMRYDRGSRFLFAALQGNTARESLNTESINSPPDSIVLLQKREIYRGSTAVLKIISDLNGLWKLARLFLFIPSSLRDSVYFFIARNRYRWFGKRDTCRLPSAEERAKFLD